MALSLTQEHDILRYYFAEQWRVGTIARQLGLHHSTVERVIARAGVPKPERSQRASIIDPYLPFIVETLQQPFETDGHVFYLTVLDDRASAFQIQVGDWTSQVVTAPQDGGSFVELVVGHRQ